MKSHHMTTEEFRRAGHRLVDWIADYRERIESFPVLSKAEPGELRAALPDRAPETGEAFEAIQYAAVEGGDVAEALAGSAARNRSRNGSQMGAARSRPMHIQ